MGAIGLADLRLKSASQRLQRVSAAMWTGLRAQPAGRWAKATEVVAVVVLAAFSAQLVLTFAGAPAWPASPVQRVSAVGAQAHASWDRNALTRVDPFRSGESPASMSAQPRAPETTLALQLFGIRAGANGSAIIGGPDLAQQAYAIGQEIMPGVRLERVTAGGVIIRRNGVAESISLDKEVPAAAVGPAVAANPSVAEAQDDWRRISGDAAALFAGIQLGARDEGGVVLLSGAPLAQFGFLPGDILVAVNGAPVRDAASLLGAATTWRDAERLSLEIERGGQRKIHKIAIDR